jgi:hypothetical protein
MFKNISRARVIGAWCAAIVLIGASALVAGAAPTAANGELLLVAGLMPPAVLLFLWRDAPVASVSELLHAADVPAKEARS